MLTSLEAPSLALRLHLPLEVVVNPQHCFVLLARVLDVDTTGKAQLVLCKAQLL